MMYLRMKNDSRNRRREHMYFKRSYNDKGTAFVVFDVDEDDGDVDVDSVFVVKSLFRRNVRTA